MHSLVNRFKRNVRRLIFFVTNGQASLMSSDCAILSSAGASMGIMNIDTTSCCDNMVDVITCDDEFNIISINWKDSGLSGRLDSGIFTLPELKSLDLSDNNLKGQLSTFPGSLEVLNLSTNRLNGTMPTLPEALREFKIDNNFFTGILGELPDSLENVDVSFTDLSGQLPLFPANIQTFNASTCDFTGQLPELPESLTFLDVNSNNLMGTIPKLPSQLIELSIWGNTFNSTLPSLPTSLQSLLAGDAGLYGKVGALPLNLEFLDLSDNDLSGNITIHRPHTFYIQYNSFNKIEVSDLSELGNCDISGNSVLNKDVAYLAKYCTANDLLDILSPNPPVDSPTLDSNTSILNIVYGISYAVLGIAVLFGVFVIGVCVRDRFRDKTISKTKIPIPFRKNPFSKNDRVKSEALLR